MWRLRCDDSLRAKTLAIAFWVHLLFYTIPSVGCEVWSYLETIQIAEFLSSNPQAEDLLLERFRTYYIYGIWVIPIVTSFIGLMCSVKVDHILQLLKEEDEMYYHHNNLDNTRASHMSFFIAASMCIIARIFLWHALLANLIVVVAIVCITILYAIVYNIIIHLAHKYYASIDSARRQLISEL